MNTIKQNPDNQSRQSINPKNPGSDSQSTNPLIPVMKYTDITHKIIGSAMEVHNILGNGFQEVVYQRSLAIEMGNQNVMYQREVEMPIFYKGNDVGTRRVDFLVDKKILVELKAVITLDDVHLAQALNYLEAFNLEIGLLLNFGAKSLQFKRLLNKKYNPAGS